MDLAKDRADVGLFTNRYDEMRDFYGGRLGLKFLETAGIGKVQQHRYDLGGSWLKINTASNPLPPRSPGGYQKLVIPTAQVTQPQTLTDPDGNAIELVPPGYNGVDHVELQLGVSDVPAFERFHAEVLGSTRIGPARFRLGRSILSFSTDPAATHYVAPPRKEGETPNLLRATAALVGLGWRYFTVQVRDCGAEHERVLGAGGHEGSPVMPGPAGGPTIAIFFIRDPDGNWIEVVQRK
jgi:catechol 2,3-dioxygenase-like lactoylglutathione lyase family enzyme